MTPPTKSNRSPNCAVSKYYIEAQPRHLSARPEEKCRGGLGVVIIDGVPHNVEKGSAVFIPGDVEHSVTNNEKEELKCLYVFPATKFSDIVYHFAGTGRLKL
ncbi:hypothetical protein BDV23DRAFT_184441 [Aspergillus alliaceus]|uniref:Cupin type-2 domain-containing protein n=1 Tax=Petromyces alliaceus TaxID=209559 RepID=A0A5N7C6X0_PETAA|nr:hypothetical protein BDV23DRAFT_184441 [Aspergillus alliaceus]